MFWVKNSVNGFCGAGGCGAGVSNVMSVNVGADINGMVSSSISVGISMSKSLGRGMLSSSEDGSSTGNSSGVVVAVSGAVSGAVGMTDALAEGTFGALTRGVKPLAIFTRARI